MRSKIKAKYKVFVQPYIQGEDGVIELQRADEILYLPSVHVDYLQAKVVDELNKKMPAFMRNKNGFPKVVNYKLLNYIKIK